MSLLIALGAIVSGLVCLIVFVALIWAEPVILLFYGPFFWWLWRRFKRVVAKERLKRAEAPS